jgi:hypothetical protein
MLVNFRINIAELTPLERHRLQKGYSNIPGLSPGGWTNPKETFLCEASGNGGWLLTFSDWW